MKNTNKNTKKKALKGVVSILLSAMMITSATGMLDFQGAKPIWGMRSLSKK